MYVVGVYFKHVYEEMWMGENRHWNLHEVTEEGKTGIVTSRRYLGREQCYWNLKNMFKQSHTDIGIRNYYQIITITEPNPTQTISSLDI